MRFANQTIKRLFWQWRGVVIAAPSVAGLVLLLRFTGLLQAWEWAAFDQFMRLRPNASVDNRVVIVGIDEADISYVGQPIFPDQVYADLIEKLKARQPRAIGLDVYRNLPVGSGHQKLVQLFNSTPNLVGIQKVVGKTGLEAVDAPPALKAKGQVGSNDLVLDADNRVRRAFLSVDSLEGEKVYSFGFYLALLYLDQAGINPEEIPGTQDWRLGKAKFPPFNANDGGYVRADDRGHQILLNYRGGNQLFQVVSLRDVLQDKLPPDWGRDAVILIGGVGESSGDLFFTPYSSTLLSLPQRMPGVEIHANLVSQIISAAIDGHPLVQSWSEPWEWVWIFAWSSMGAILIWQFRNPLKGQNRVLQGISSFVPMVLVLLGSAYIALCYGWWIPLVPALVGMVGAAVVVTSYVARTASDIRKTFGRYLSDEIVANLLENPEGLALGGERRTITLLTSDIRGFTSIAERMPPEQVIKIINFYLGHMAEVITRYQGTIDEFMGDGILVLFGAPTSRKDDAERAIACAIAMQLAMEEVNLIAQDWNLPPLEMGIGINTGDVVVGNIGSEKRSKYGVVGSQVNLTYRIESYTTGGQILISEETLKQVGDIVQIKSRKEVKPKGVLEAVPVYEVCGICGDFDLFLPQEEEVFLPLPQNVPIQYTLLDGKSVGEMLYQAHLTQLSHKSALVSIELSQDKGLVVPPLTNIKLNLLLPPDATEMSEDVYAKVLETPAAPNSFYIQFTSKPVVIAAKLEELYRSLETIATP